MSRKNTKPRRGRPSLAPQLMPWLKKMHIHVKAGLSERAAAGLIVKSDERLIPQGSRHGQRKPESTVDLLRSAYSVWRQEQASAEPQSLVVRIGEDGVTGKLSDTLELSALAAAVERAGIGPVGRKLSEMVARLAPYAELVPSLPDHTFREMSALASLGQRCIEQIRSRNSN